MQYTKSVYKPSKKEAEVVISSKDPRSAWEHNTRTEPLTKHLPSISRMISWELRQRTSHLKVSMISALTPVAQSLQAARVGTMRNGQASSPQEIPTRPSHRWHSWTQMHPPAKKRHWSLSRRRTITQCVKEADRLLGSQPLGVHCTPALRPRAQAVSKSVGQNIHHQQRIAAPQPGLR